jgi:hypothetical protein
MIPPNVGLAPPNLVAMTPNALMAPPKARQRERAPPKVRQKKKSETRPHQNRTGSKRGPCQMRRSRKNIPGGESIHPSWGLLCLGIRTLAFLNQPPWPLGHVPPHSSNIAFPESRPVLKRCHSLAFKKREKSKKKK